MDGERKSRERGAAHKLSALYQPTFHYREGPLIRADTDYLQDTPYAAKQKPVCIYDLARNRPQWPA